MISQYACLVFPMPPTTNNLFAGFGKRRYKSAAYRDWLAEAQLALMRQKPTPCFDGPVDIVISVEPPGNRRADISNKIKALEDFLVSNGIIEDDAKVRRVTAQWHRHVIGARVEIESAPGRVVEDAARRVA